MRPSSSQLGAGIFSGLIAALVWGSWPIISRLAVNGHLNAYDITALRFGISGVILLPVLWRRGLSQIPKRAIALLVLGAGAPYVLLGVGALKLAPAGHFGIITPSSMLLASCLGAWLVLGEVMTRTRLIGLALILGGIALVGFEGLKQAGGHLGPGHLLFILCGSMWAIYNIGSRYFHIAPLHGTAIVSVFSMVLYLPFYLIWGLDHLLAAPVGEILIHGLFQGVITAILALVMFTRATALLGAGRGSTFSALSPAFSLLLAWPLLGDRPNQVEIMGLLLVSGGMLTAVLGRQTPPRETA